MKVLKEERAVAVKMSSIRIRCISRKLQTFVTNRVRSNVSPFITYLSNLVVREPQNKEIDTRKRKKTTVQFKTITTSMILVALSLITFELIHHALNFEAANCTPLNQIDNYSSLNSQKHNSSHYTDVKYRNYRDYSRSNEVNNRKRRAATARQDRLWDDAVIPYEIDPIFSEEKASLFRSAMRHWENYTCLKFVERIPEEHRNYIVFVSLKCGCCSYVGKKHGGQAISIGKHCDKFGIVLHELAHIIGNYHENSREDRDQYVQILEKNIMPGQEHNFNKLTKNEVNSLGFAYDYDSILHYATNTFAKDPNLDTIIPLHGYLNTVEVQEPISSPSANTTLYNQHPVNVSTDTPLEPNNRNNAHVAPQTNLNKTTTKNIDDTQMNNDDGDRRTDSTILDQLESMLQFNPDRAKVTDSKLRSRSPEMLLLDGSILVKVDSSSTNNNKTTIKSANNTQEKRVRRESLNVDDKLHMLAMDNILAETRPEIGQRVRLSVGDIAQTNALYKCPKCGRTIQQTSGLFNSPNYYTSSDHHVKKPKSSSNEQNSDQNVINQPVGKDLCEWRITVGLGERIMINISDLDLPPPTPTQTNSPSSVPSGVTNRLGMPKVALSNRELHDVIESSPKGYMGQLDPMIMLGCTSDYVEIRDGYTHRAPLIAKLCGHIATLRDIMRPIVSTSNRVLVSYKITSASTGKRGFLAQHETLCGGYIMLGNTLLNDPPPPTITPKVQAQLPSVVVHKQSSFDKQFVNISQGINGVKLINPQLINGSSPSENEVLSSSQTNLRYNQFQSQQPSSISIEGSTVESQITLRNQTTTLQPPSLATTTLEQSAKTFSWTQWPAINSSFIQSPNWPDHYRSSKECIWQVKADENHQISLRFDAFDLEPHDSCAYDYVEIHDGDSLNSGLIGRFCGNRIPEAVLSSSRSLLVKFVSDSDVNRRGFLASLQQELDECKLDSHGCSYKCSNAALPARCECPSGLELANDGRNCVPSCGGTRNQSTGQITSPLFPDLYPISTKCIWEIIAPANHRITLNFTYFDLEGIRAQECDYDFVEISSKLEHGKHVKHGIFCGPNQAFVVTSVANIMKIEFNSDNSIQKSGFVANYFTDEDECGTNNGGCQHICTNKIGTYQCSCNNGYILHGNNRDCIEGNCTYSIIEPEGILYSPNFPNSYRSNKECAWVFSTAPGHRIKLIFDQFDLEGHQECAYDHITVFDGESEDSLALGKFCGSRRPLTLVSSFNMLSLLFRSDATNEKHGFNATHSTVCGGRLQANLNQNDVIYSHPLFDTVTHYNRNEDCEWIIEASYNQRVRIEFTFFALEADNNCNYDQTNIYDGPDDSSTQLARFCGTDIPKEQLKIISSGESMLIVFRSDDSINNRGFSLTYTAIERSEYEPVAITHSTNTKYTQSS